MIVLQRTAPVGVEHARYHVQAVPLAGSGAGLGDTPSAPTAYEWSEALNEGTLLAVGGSIPATVHLWNLQQELCVEQVCTCCII